jgi:hypothetical protein
MPTKDSRFQIPAAHSPTHSPTSGAVPNMSCDRRKNGWWVPKDSEPAQKRSVGDIAAVLSMSMPCATSPRNADFATPHRDTHHPPFQCCMTQQTHLLPCPVCFLLIPSPLYYIPTAHSSYANVPNGLFPLA